MNTLLSQNRWLTLGVTLIALACSSNDEKQTVRNDPPNIVGAYHDSWGAVNQITAKTWTMDKSVFHIAQVDNRHEFLIAQNDAANEFNKELWSRFDWTYDSDDTLWFCQTAYAAVSADKARETPAADASSLGSGCAGFAWSKLIPDAADAGD